MPAGNHQTAREHFVTFTEIAVIAFAPTGKAPFVYSYVQTRLMGQYNGKRPISLDYVLKLLITAIRAISVDVITCNRGHK